MTDEELVEQTALDYLRFHGTEVIPMLLERAEVDAALGDRLSAQTWRDIADAAKKIMARGWDRLTRILLISSIFAAMAS